MTGRSKAKCTRASVAVAGAVAVLVSGQVAGAGDKAPIVIGASISYTGAFAGPVAQWAAGWKDYLAQVNAVGGVNGRKIVLVEADDEYRADLSLGVYRRLMATHPLAIFVLAGSAQVAMVYPVVRQRPVPIMTVGAETLGFANPRNYPFSFGTVLATYTDQARVTLRFLKAQADRDKRPLPRIGLLTSGELPWGVEIEHGFKAYTEKLGFRCQIEHIEIGAAEAVEQLQRLKQFGADWILFFQAPATLGLLLKTAGEIGYKPTVVAFHWALWEPMMESLGPLAEGVVLVNGWLPWGARPDHPGMRKLMSVRRRAGRIEPHTIHYPLGYVKAAVTVEAIRLAGADLTAAGIKGGFERIRDFDVDGLAPRVSIGPDDHRGNLTYYFWRLQNKRFVKIGEATLDRRDAPLEVE